MYYFIAIKMQDLWNELGMLNTTFVKETDDFSQMPYRAMPYYIKDDNLYPLNTTLIKYGFGDIFQFLKVFLTLDNFH